MALKEDYLDDILDTSVNEKRKYRMINNADGTISLEDVTEYSQNGDNFGSSDINITNKTINELIAMGLNVRWNNETDFLEILSNGKWERSNLNAGINVTKDIILALTDYSSSYGKCVFSSKLSDTHAPWKAFDKDDTTFGACNSTSEYSYIGFEWYDVVYVDNVSVHMAYTHGEGSHSLNLKLQYYNGTDWVDVENTEFNETYLAVSRWQYFDYNFSVKKDVRGIRFYGTVVSGEYPWALFIKEMQAYGR